MLDFVIAIKCFNTVVVDYDNYQIHVADIY